MRESSEYTGLTTEEGDRIEQFEVHYNAVKAELARRLGKSDKANLNELVLEWGRLHRRWHSHDGADLLDLASLRNLLVHDRTEPYDYLACPTAQALERIAKIHYRLASPLRISQVVDGDRVITVAPQDSLAHVLDIVAHYNYSQYPVYEGTTMLGLLTATDIVRWLSKYYQRSKSQVIPESLVEEILGRGSRAHYAFIRGDLTVEEAIDLLSAQPSLMCLLVTAQGSENGLPQAIITRHDVASLLARLIEHEAPAASKVGKLQG